MRLNQILVSNEELEIKINGPEEFSNLGTLLSDEDSLLSFAASPDYFHSALEKDNLVALFVKKGFVTGTHSDVSFIFSERPMVDFFLFHNYLAQNTEFYGTEKPTQISGTAKIHPTAFVAKTNVEISDGVTISPKAVILENTIIQADVYIGSGTVIGIDGTQTIPFDGRRHFRITHAGGVFVGEGTFVGANSVIVKSLFREYSMIGTNVTIGNLVNIGHNTRIGDDSIILANSVVCGSATVERGARISPGATISSSKSVGENAWITIGAVVTKDVEKGQRVSGNFAIEHRKLVDHIKRLSRAQDEHS